MSNDTNSQQPQATETVNGTPQTDAASLTDREVDAAAAGRGNNVFGFEDLPNNIFSDMDFNDAIFSF